MALFVSALAFIWFAAPDNAVSQEPTIVLVSIDGFRADYLDWYQPKTLLEIAEEGVRAEYLEPVFPSSTFPNHYALVTGRYAENHGIVSNRMNDPDLGVFNPRIKGSILTGEWWDDAEPLWATMHRSGLRSFINSWPGSEASINGIRPTFFREFRSDTPGETRINWVLEGLTSDIEPQLVTLYFQSVDDAGHRFGPESPEMADAVREVDSYLGLLVEKLGSEGLLDEVNLVITSDHGMTTISRDSVILLDDYIDLDMVEVAEWRPIVALKPRDADAAQILGKLQDIQHVSFYQKDEIPARLHYNNHERIHPIIGIPDPGWTVTNKRVLESNPSLYDGGAHGYDPAYPAMRGIFIARGPAFTKGAVVDGFSIVHVYGLLCKILGITPAPNDGDLSTVIHLLQ